MQRQERPAPWRQPFVVERIGDRNQRRDRQQPGEDNWPLFQVVVMKRTAGRKTGFPGGSSASRNAAGAGNFPLEDLGEQLGQAVFQHQPDPAHQHDVVIQLASPC
jgi:hypothetical protein